MDKRELSVGNWIWRPDCYDQVVEIRSDGIIGIDEGVGVIPFEDIKPIPIYGETLERNGFHKEFDGILECDQYVSEDGRVILNNDERFLNSMKHWSIHVDNASFCSIGSCEIDSIHELQGFLLQCGIEPDISMFRRKEN